MAPLAVSITDLVCRSRRHGVNRRRAERARARGQGRGGSRGGRRVGGVDNERTEQRGEGTDPPPTEMKPSQPLALENSIAAFGQQRTSVRTRVRTALLRAATRPAARGQRMTSVLSTSVTSNDESVGSTITLCGGRGGGHRGGGARVNGGLRRRGLMTAALFLKDREREWASIVRAAIRHLVGMAAGARWRREGVRVGRG